MDSVRVVLAASESTPERILESHPWFIIVAFTQCNQLQYFRGRADRRGTYSEGGVCATSWAAM
jgi:hypothetical protein